MVKTELALKLPEWSKAFLDRVRDRRFGSDQEKMELVVSLLETHLIEKSGGPFAAAVFDPEGKLIAAGVNVVVPLSNSTAHAEMIAIQLAEAFAGKYTLGEGYALATSAQPCAQCYGAIFWSGVKKLLIGVPAEFTESLGFYEGPIHPDWRAELQKGGITLSEGLYEQEIQTLMRRYNGEIYNG